MSVATTLWPWCFSNTSLEIFWSCNIATFLQPRPALVMRVFWDVSKECVWVCLCVCVFRLGESWIFSKSKIHFLVTIHKRLGTTTFLSLYPSLSILYSLLGLFLTLHKSAKLNAREFGKRPNICKYASEVLICTSQIYSIFLWN